MEIIFGIIIGLILANLMVWNPWTATGVMRVDHTNPDKDSYLLEIDDLDQLNHKKRIIIAIDHNANLSRD